MINNNTKKSLEFDKILEKISSFAYSKEIKEKILNIKPKNDITIINRELNELLDIVNLVIRNGDISLYGLCSLNECISRLKIGADLNIVEILTILRHLKLAKNIREYYRNFENNNIDIELLPQTKDLFTEIMPLSNLIIDIEKIIISEDEINDEASNELSQIRRKIKKINAKIVDKINIIKNDNSKYLQEQIITTKKGRYCLPVKSENRSMVDGIIHDKSTTGSTIFIEPKVIIDLNNELYSLYEEEQLEIQRILSELSDKIRENIDIIILNEKILFKLDFLVAKAKYAKETNSTKPILKNSYEKDFKINVKKARHPLIDKNKVVPIDIALEKNIKQLVITGPNTGGKTVSIKTYGLLTIMAQSSIFVTCEEGSIFRLVDGIYCDIGDEQSIEQSLSTFSAHLTNIINILNNMKENSLLIFDEFFSGTDPVEGAALAKSFLEYLLKKDVLVFATTHYSELKMYALSNENVINGSLLFDVETLSPTYKLVLGIPGKSNAFLISEKLGLPLEIIDKAKNYIDDTKTDFEDILTNIDKKRTEIDKLLLENIEINENNKKLEEKLKNELEKQKNQKIKILNDAKEEARILLQSTKDYADDILRKFNKANKSIKELDIERQKLGKDLKEFSKKEKIEKKYNNGEKRENYNIGDTVFIISMEIEGVIKEIGKKGYVVASGIMNMTVNKEDLLYITPKKEKIQNNFVNIKYDKVLNAKTSINLIGKIKDDAIYELTKFMDDALLANLDRVTIIHGMGQGILKKATRDYLKSLKYVKKIETADSANGGDGATFAYLK